MENLYEKLSDVLDTFGDEADYVGDMTHAEIKDLIQQAQALVEMFQNELETVGVEEVLNLAAADLEATPDFGSQIATDYIFGMAKVRGTVKTLLDVDRVVAAEASDVICHLPSEQNPNQVASTNTP